MRFETAVTKEMLLFPNIRRSIKARACYIPFAAPHWRQVRFCAYSVGNTDIEAVRTRHITDNFCLLCSGNLRFCYLESVWFMIHKGQHLRLS